MEIFSGWRRALDVVTTLVLAIMGTVVIWNNVGSRRLETPRVSPREPSVPDRPIEIGNQLKGSRNAPVGLVVFSDFECPFCGQFARSVMPVLERKYVQAGRLLIGFRHFPMEAIHRNALYAAQAAACANERGRFWELHDRLFAVSSRLDKQSIERAFVEVSLDSKFLAECANRSGRGVIDQDLADAMTLDVSGSPAIFVGRLGPDGRIVVSRRINGVRPLEVFERAIDEVLGNATGL